MICVWSSWCHCHLTISCFTKIQNALTFFGAGWPSLSWKRAAKRVSVCLSVCLSVYIYHYTAMLNNVRVVQWLLHLVLSLPAVQHVTAPPPSHHSALQGCRAAAVYCTFNGLHSVISQSHSVTQAAGVVTPLLQSTPKMSPKSVKSTLSKQLRKKTETCQQRSLARSAQIWW